MKISVYIDEEIEKGLGRLIETHPELEKRNRSSLINLLLKKEMEKQCRNEMLEAAGALDELDIGWSQEEKSCLITDLEASGK